MIADHRFVIVLVTTPPGRKGAEIASRLVEENLASCVNRIGNMESTYAWEGKVECEGEDLLLIKTSREKLDDVERTILSLHPYDLPEIIVVPIEGGSRPYLEWLAGPGETPPQ